MKVGWIPDSEYNKWLKTHTKEVDASDAGYDQGTLPELIKRHTSLKKYEDTIKKWPNKKYAMIGGYYVKRIEKKNGVKAFLVRKEGNADIKASKKGNRKLHFPGNRSKFELFELVGKAIYEQLDSQRSAGYGKTDDNKFEVIGEEEARRRGKLLERLFKNAAMNALDAYQKQHGYKNKQETIAHLVKENRVGNIGFWLPGIGGKILIYWKNPKTPTKNEIRISGLEDVRVRGKVAQLVRNNWLWKKIDGR
ncbi:MAG: hypothetical protein KGH62_03405, partial [Candidatus Micrarchaeota archaeon]|nr:hypothetical protein [Candidatus Micrarchaeota archaeon]